MFARTLKVVGAVTTLIAGSACKDLNDCFCDVLDTFAAAARGANVVPAATDTTPRGAVTFNTTTLAYTYTVATPPAGTIDSIALYQVVQGDVLPPSATVILCAGAAACAATTGTARLVSPATRTSIITSMRAYGTHVVFFTTAAQKAAGGAMRGTMYPSPI